MLTLNLIPPAVKRDYESSERLHHWLNAVVVLTVTVFLGTIGITGTWVMLNRHATAVASDLQRIQQQQATSNGRDITSTTSTLNATIKTLTSTLGTPRSWATDVTTVLTGLPKDIAISSLTIQQTGQFRLIGVANSRQAFVQLEDALKANTKLSNVTTSLTASKRTAVPFDYTGKLAAAKTP